ncbi:MAG: hypothetical protein ACE144_21610 [Thermodesulfobacteriota bacterium]
MREATPAFCSFPFPVIPGPIRNVVVLGLKGQKIALLKRPVSNQGTRSTLACGKWRYGHVTLNLTESGKPKSKSDLRGILALATTFPRFAKNEHGIIFAPNFPKELEGEVQRLLSHLLFFLT